MSLPPIDHEAEARFERLLAEKRRAEKRSATRKLKRLLRNDLAWFLLGLGGLIGGIIWYFEQHPCIRWEQSTCSSCENEMPMLDENGSVTGFICISWEEHPCTVCVERAP